MVEIGKEFSKLKPQENDMYELHLELLLIPGEEILYTFNGLGQGVVFTNKRIFIIEIPSNGKRKDYSSIPYTSIVRFGVDFENAVDVEGVLTISLINSDKMSDFKFSFQGPIELSAITRLISLRIL